MKVPKKEQLRSMLGKIRPDSAASSKCDCGCAACKGPNACR